MYDAYVEPNALDAIEREGGRGQHTGCRRDETCLLLGTDAGERADHGSRLTRTHFDQREELAASGDHVDLEGTKANVLAQNNETARDQVVARGLFRSPPEGVAAWCTFHLAELLAAGAAAALSPLHCVRVLAASQSPVQSTAGLYFVSCLMQ